MTLIKTYPIAETFLSVQGEGMWTGTPMFFLRLAGCNVGKYSTPIEDERSFPIIYNEDWSKLRDMRHSYCTSHDGTRFLCDTDYHKSETKTIEEIMEKILAVTPKIRHVCLTGGEPFMHDVRPLMDSLLQHFMIHIETSGTKPIPAVSPNETKIWITCCPKAGFLLENRHVPNEWKFVVDFRKPIEDTILDIETFLQGKASRAVYIQPINAVASVDRQAMKYAQSIVFARPLWRLSAQLHKYLEVR